MSQAWAPFQLSAIDKRRCVERSRPGRSFNGEKRLSGGRSSLGDSGPAHVLNDPRALSEVDGIVAPCGGLKIRDSELRVESESSRGLGSRLFHSTEIRQRRRENEMT